MTESRVNLGFKQMLKKVSFQMILVVALGVLGFSLLLVGCNAAGSGDEPAMEDGEMEHGEGMEHNGEHEHDSEHEHEGSEERIPNPNGAAIQILSPANGDTFSANDELLVEVNVDNFALGEDDNHWHVYVDGTSWGMVTGGNLDQPLRGLEPGMHEISVFIAGGDHIEFMQGDAIMVRVE